MSDKKVFGFDAGLEVGGTTNRPPDEDDATSAHKAKPQKLYDFFITLGDTGLPYSSYEEAKKDAEDWAAGLGDQENCAVLEVKVNEVRE